MHGITKNGKFIPFGNNRQKFNGKVIMRNESGKEVGITKLNFNMDSEKILEAKKLHIITEIEGQKVAEETINIQ